MARISLVLAFRACRFTASYICALSLAAGGNGLQAWAASPDSAWYRDIERPDLATASVTIGGDGRDKRRRRARLRCHAARICVPHWRIKRTFCASAHISAFHFWRHSHPHAHSRRPIRKDDQARHFLASLLFARRRVNMFGWLRMHKRTGDQDRTAYLHRGGYICRCLCLCLSATPSTITVARWRQPLRDASALGSLVPLREQAYARTRLPLDAARCVDIWLRK